MKKVASINERKQEHIRISLDGNIGSRKSSGLEKYEFIHAALPELDLSHIEHSAHIFSKVLRFPLLISSMTGGTAMAEKINVNLAEAAEETGIAMGVGSQRIAIEDPTCIPSFSLVRKTAPKLLLFANLGAIQLNNGYGIKECNRAVDMIQADALILHLNPLQEAIQGGGETNFLGLAKKIEFICHKLHVPVIAKEVGWGISTESARILAECGVTAIDVAGAGGTSWSQVEMLRSSAKANDNERQMAEPFVDWGISTAVSITNVRQTVPDMMVFASGGLRSGMDIGKCIALGASLGGMAQPYLKAATISAEKVVETIQLFSQQLMLTMFGCGAGNLNDLKRKLVKIE